MFLPENGDLSSVTMSLGPVQNIFISDSCTLIIIRITGIAISKSAPSLSILAAYLHSLDLSTTALNTCSKFWTQSHITGTSKIQKAEVF